MDELSSDVVSLLVYLLPGLAAAWIFYGLTSHARPTQFERLIQALIFTFIIQTFLPALQWILEVAGHVFYLKEWDKAANLLGSLFLSVALGATLAFFTNNDSFHQLLRKYGFTSRTSHPSEWFCAFNERVTYVILNLRDGRRLYGWPKEWPIDPASGQFYIQQPSWILEDGSLLDLPQLNGVLIQVKDVEWVEFMQHKEKEK